MTARLPTAALFDLDGTLVDREPLFAAAVGTVLARHGAAPDPRVLGATTGRAWQDVHEALGVRDALGWELERFLVEVDAEADRLRRSGHATPALPGAVALVRHLAVTRGVPVLVVTGSRRAEAGDALDDLGIGGHLTGLVAAEDYAAGKPAPDCFLVAAERLGIDAERDGGRCVVFEDSVAGVAAARAAGMRVVATEAANAPPGHHAHQDLTGADVVVPGLDHVTDDLLAALVG